MIYFVDFTETFHGTALDDVDFLQGWKTKSEIASVKAPQLL